MILPDAGDISWVEFDPVKGSEQAGRRPALVLSPRAYHEQTRRVVVCPITSRIRNWPFNVLLPAGLSTQGMVLVDQIRAIDRSARMFALIERVSDATLDEVRARLFALVGLELRGFEDA